MRILIIDKPRERSPLLTLFYKELEKDGHIWWEGMDAPCNLNDYTHIYWGFTPGTALKNYSKEINDSGVKIIYDPGDLSELVAGHRPIVENLSPVGVDYIIARWPKADKDELDYRPDFYNFIHDTDWIKGPVIHIPWACNYSDPKWERPIDVAMMHTVAEWEFHSDRRRALESLQGIHCKKVIDNWWDKEYRDILRTTKMFVVDPSRRDFPVQKYFEAPACGAVIIGKIPTPLKDVFENDISCIELKDYSDLGPKVVEYLQRPDDLIRISEEGQRRISNFSLDKSVSLLYNGLKG